MTIITVTPNEYLQNLALTLIQNGIPDLRSTKTFLECNISTPSYRQHGKSLISKLVKSMGKKDEVSYNLSIIAEVLGRAISSGVDSTYTLLALSELYMNEKQREESGALTHACCNEFLLNTTMYLDLLEKELVDQDEVNGKLSLNELGFSVHKFITGPFTHSRKILSSVSDLYGTCVKVKDKDSYELAREAYLGAGATGDITENEYTPPTEGEDYRLYGWSEKGFSVFANVRTELYKQVFHDTNELVLVHKQLKRGRMVYI
jgi:hypothetical protein